MKSFGFPWRSTFLADYKKSCFNQPGLKFLSDARLVSKTAGGGVALVEGGRSAADILMNNDLVGLYFSAHWCGPCRGFTPVFAEVYTLLYDIRMHSIVTHPFVTHSFVTHSFIRYSNTSYHNIPYHIVHSIIYPTRHPTALCHMLSLAYYIPSFITNPPCYHPSIPTHYNCRSTTN